MPAYRTHLTKAEIDAELTRLRAVRRQLCDMYNSSKLARAGFAVEALHRYGAGCCRKLTVAPSGEIKGMSFYPQTGCKREISRIEAQIAELEALASYA